MRVGKRLARLAHGERAERRALCLEEVGGALEACRALAARRRDHAAPSLDAQRDGARDVVGGRPRSTVPTTSSWSAGLRTRSARARGRRRRPREHRRGVQRRGAAASAAASAAQRRSSARSRPREFAAVPEAAPPAAGCAGAARRRRRVGQRDRIRDELGDADRGIDDAVDERGVRAVLEQPPHEIGEQRLVRADRRIDAARAVELVRADDLVVEALAHAVQALELVLPRRRRACGPRRS